MQDRHLSAPIILTLGLLFITTVAVPVWGATPQVTAQGKIRSDPPAARRSSPSGGFQMASPSGAVQMTAWPRSTGDSSFLWDLEVRSVSGDGAALSGVEASAFFLSDLPCLIALIRQETDAVPGVLRVYDLGGHLLHEEAMDAPTSPALSPDGTTMAWAAPGALQILDLRDFRSRTYPYLGLFGLGSDGQVAGVSKDENALKVFHPSGLAYSIPLFPDTAARTRKLAMFPDGSAVLLLLPASLVRVEIPSGNAAAVYEAPPFTELRDVSVDADEILVGMRRVEGDRFVGSMAVLDPEGGIREITRGTEQAIPRAPRGELDPGIPWPIAPDAQHPIGNTYGEYQNYGGAPYPHPGIDVLGSAGQPVFAVRRGVVKAILTTSGQWHWRVAVGDSAVATTIPGYLYAHLDQATIAVDVGDPVAAGQYLGNLVEWPVASFHHCHFTRIEDSGTTWDGTWLSVHNPHVDLTHQSEADPPVFEPARPNNLLAFCLNQTSTYLNPNQLHGAVDIIAHVGDRIASNWVCTVQELRYTIYPAGNPGNPLVDDKLAQYFDMTCDTYAGGQIDAFLISLLYKDDAICNTQGDYDFREFFHIITNSDGDRIYEQSDLNEAWDTSDLLDGDYVVRVTAIDGRGNATSDSMVVTTVNGNTTGMPEVPEVAASQPPLRLDPVWPNPAGPEAWVRFHLSAPDRIILTMYDATGRQVRLLQDGWTESGGHALRWTRMNTAGWQATPGVYFLRLRGELLGTVTRKLVIAP